MYTKLYKLFDLRATYGHFAGTPFIQPRLATIKGVVDSEHNQLYAANI